MSKLDKVPILEHTGFNPRNHCAIPTLKNSQYFVLDDYTISGDAPKDLIKVYEYGKAKKVNRKKWPIYIAKVGHKWYPNESITEYLLNQIGLYLGFHVASSRLVRVGEQVRFLSEYFKRKDQILVHGAEIYAGYLEDPPFVEEIEERGMARDLFTLQFTKDAITKSFPEQAEELIHSFVKMLIFDAIVGNNDRHFYNWGVITHLARKHAPFFSPIYDTARGLYWNFREQNILHLSSDFKEEKYRRYIINSRPKIGWEGQKNLNHLQLVKLITRNEFGISKEEVKNLLSEKKARLCIDQINKNFNELMSPERLSVVVKCLELRFRFLNQVI
mgnify:CR=1 FL=1